MADAIRQGKVLYWGTSCWTAAQLRETHQICRDLGAPGPIVEQPCYNLLDRSIEAQILPEANRLGMGIAPWSPLAGGVLTGKYNQGKPPQSRGAQSGWLDRTLTPENIERVREFTNLAQEAGHLPEQLALAWLLHQPGVATVLTGATRLEHVDKNRVAADLELDADLLGRIDQIFSEEGSP
jgi:aryl-alcohol dehydrogenase-like predicted oxidoreductase